MLGGHRHAVEGGRLIVPLAEGRFDFFVDAMADGPHDARFDDVPGRVDGDLDDGITIQIGRKLRARHGRVGKHDWVRHVHFAWALVTTPEGTPDLDLLQGPNEVYAGNWLDDVLASGGGQAYAIRPEL